MRNIFEEKVLSFRAKEECSAYVNLNKYFPSALSCSPEKNEH